MPSKRRVDLLDPKAKPASPPVFSNNQIIVYSSGGPDTEHVTAVAALQL